MTQPPEKWLHLAGSSHDPWVLPIWGAAEAAAAEGRLSPLAPDIRAVGVHASTRLWMLPQALVRVRDGARAVFSAIADRGPEDEFSPNKPARAFPVPGQTLAQLQLDLDSVLFELNSACELTTELYRRLHMHAGHLMSPSEVGRSIRDSLDGAGVRSGWFRTLDKHRNMFMHNAAPYLIVDLSAPWGGGYDILIMNEGSNDLTDEKRFLRLSTLDAVVRDFQTAMPIMQRQLVTLLSSARTLGG